jgi:hypothetical protein
MDKDKELKNIIKTKEDEESSKMTKKEVKEFKELVPPFSIKKEISKINIHAPWVELTKNTSYQKKIENTI